jgi:hypothetical protein
MSNVVNQEVYAEELLDRLVSIDLATVENYYEMGSILSAIKHGQLYLMLEYKSMNELIGCELSFTATTARKYAQMYDRFRELKYNKTEAVELLRRFGLTHMVKILPTLKQKVGVRTIQRKLAEIDEVQLNFTLTSEEVEEVHSVLRKYGARLSSNGARWNDVSIAFLSAIRAAANKNEAA